MPLISEIIAAVERVAPPQKACAFDNVGLQIGDSDRGVFRVILSLNATSEVADEAITKKADLIITHHPLLSDAIKSVTADNPVGALLLKLAENNIAVYSAHTNLDQTSHECGTNEVLCRLYGLENISPILESTAKDGTVICLGRAGDLPREMTLTELAAHVGKSIGYESVRFSGAPDTKISRVALCAGSGGGESDIEKAAKSGVGCYITGDTKYHPVLYALSLGMCVVDPSHYATEIPAMECLCKMLQNEFNDVIFEMSAHDGQVYRGNGYAV
jgi:dinuclear metal center YbgI/SA1388 family protein